jgi:hypothetical protein
MGDLDQQVVALLVPERVVDLLEAVEVDQQQGREAAEALGSGELALGLLVQGDAVRQVGEPVVVGLVTQPARCTCDDPEEDEPEQEQAGAERDDQDAGVAGDRLGGRLVGHVALERAAADGHVDLDEASFGAELLLALLDVGLGLASERLADVLVCAGVLADEAVIVGPLDVAVAVVELAAQQAAGLEPAVEVGDALLPQRTGVGLSRTQLALDAHARDGHRQAPGVVDGAPLDARVQDRAQRDADGRDDHEAEHAEGLQQREPRPARSHTGVRSATAQRFLSRAGRMCGASGGVRSHRTRFVQSRPSRAGMT